MNRAMTKNLTHTLMIIREALISLLFFVGCNLHPNETNETQQAQMSDESLTYKLPAPQKEGSLSVEKALTRRRSHRSYLDKAISTEDVSQMLWAAYGITKPLSYAQTRGGLRTAPSAGALYPLEIYILIGNVKNIEPGVYKYTAKDHRITRTIDHDAKPDLSEAALNQEMIKKAPACIFYSAVFERTTQKYGERGRKRYVCMDLGHSAQNVYLQAEALHLGTCAIGAFDDEEVKAVMQLPEEEEPLYIMPIGYYYKKSEF